MKVHLIIDSAWPGGAEQELDITTTGGTTLTSPVSVDLSAAVVVTPSW